MKKPTKKTRVLMDKYNDWLAYGEREGFARFLKESWVGRITTNIPISKKLQKKIDKCWEDCGLKKLSKKELKNLIKWAQGEIWEYEKFLKTIHAELFNRSK